MNDEYRSAATLLRFTWYGAVAGAPIIGAALLLAPIWLGGPITLVDPAMDPKLSQTEFMAMAVLLMFAGIVGFKLLSSHLLVPDKIARAPLPQGIEAPVSLVSRAGVRANRAIQIVAAVLEAPALLLLLYAMVLGDSTAAWLAIIYGLTSGVVMKPDLRRLLEETAGSMQRASGA